MRRRATATAAGLAAAVVVAAAPADAAPAIPPPWPATVVLRDIAFSPAHVVVRRGATVTFAWRDGDTPHNVTPIGRHRFRRLGVRKSGVIRVRFGHRGVFRYVCTIHPGMAGRVRVR
jgi:plastocyanin